MDVPIEVPAGQQWPPGSLDLDRVTHPNGKRYLFVNGGKRDVCIFVQGFVVDLPVYKELRGPHLRPVCDCGLGTNVRSQEFTRGQCRASGQRRDSLRA